MGAVMTKEAWEGWFAENGLSAALLWEAPDGTLLGPSVDFGTPSRCTYAVRDNGTWRKATKDEYEAQQRADFSTKQ